MRLSAFVISALLLWQGTVRAAVEDQPNLPVYQTRFYDIHTDLNRDVALDLGRRMDAMYGEYQRRLARFAGNASSARSDVYLFQKQADYLRFVGEGGRNTGGGYVPATKTLASFLERQNIGSLRKSLQHEAFHQFAHASFENNLPPWLNEGMAQVFEEGIWTGREFLIGQVPPWRLRQLEANIARKNGYGLFPFLEIMSFTQDRWSKLLNSDDRAGLTEYNQSWAMVHFLVNARDETGRERFRAMFLDMLDLLHDGKSADAAFAGAFPGGNVKGFQDRFIEFARDLKPTQLASMIERQQVLADFLIELKKHGRTYKKVSLLRRDAVRGQMSMTYFGEHGVSWRTDPNVEIYFRDANDQLLADSELYFSESASARSAPLPDLVCRGAERFQLRTKFYVGASNRIERDVMIEQPGR